MDSSQQSQLRALEEAVSRVLRDNLANVQKTAEELHEACADLVAACSSTRPANALPAMLRAQTAAASLSARLEVLSNFVTSSLQPKERGAEAVELVRAVEAQFAAPLKEIPPPIMARSMEEAIVEPSASLSVEPVEAPLAEEIVESTWAEVADEVADPFPEPAVIEPTEEEQAVFDLDRLSAEEQELHRRANRVAKVTMQDIQLLRPEQVRLGREHRDLCTRLRNDLDKARREYDRRFHSILDHPVDYFHHWLVAILAGGDLSVLGEYPYPSPVLRR
jgi:hypothetical protein